MFNILCVDDTPANLITLESLFEIKSNEYSIITAQSGQDALECLLSKSVDIILLDVMMPGLDGFETAKLIKENKKTKNIPIIFLTAKRDNDTIKQAFTFGVDYLSKPYDEFELFTRVETQLKLKEANDKLQEHILFTQAVIDAQSSIVSIQGNNGLISVNKSFLEFFDVESIEQFKSRNKCISELFMEYENFFSLHVLNDDKLWVEEIRDHVSTDYNVLIMDISTFEPKAFKIEVNTIENTDKFVVTLTDITKITAKSKMYENEATYDVLTNVYNRSKFNKVFALELQTAHADNHPLSFAIFDIDFFKKVNDTYGHLIGDETLIKFASTIQENIRSTDTFARWGGEEFVLSLVGADEERAVEITNGLRKIVENTIFKEIGKVTCSVGITQLRKNDTVDDILKRADDALYYAKQKGRNQVYNIF